MQRAIAAALALALAGVASAAPPLPGAALPSTSVDGTTPLLQAAYDGDAARVAALLKAGANPRQANRYGASPLGEAAHRGDVPVMRLVLAAGADANETNPEGQTPLMAVARTGNVEAATLLLQHGAKVDTREHWGGQTALLWAAAQNQPAMLRLLISKGADVNARATVRDWQRRVTAEGRPKDMNRGGLTPLLYAAREGHLDRLRVLLRAKPQVDLPDPDGTTPLLLALLLDAGADINARVTDSHTHSAKLVAYIQGRDHEGRTALFAAAELGWERVVQHLLERGADPSIKDAAGLTALDAALAPPRTGPQAPNPSEDAKAAVVAVLSQALGVTVGGRVPAE